MIQAFLAKIFGSRNDRIVKTMSKAVAKINALEPEFKALSDADFKTKTQDFRARIEKGETLDRILPEAFACCREAAFRVLGLRHYDVQMVGGMVLHEGKIAEMRTGEGKTLMATLAVYLNALSGKGVHVVTVNDYLARRDARWMGPVYEFLGLKVGVIVPNQAMDEKREAYACDITYGTNNEYGFDYLRTNMAMNKADRLQRGLNFAIVDEVDSILIDEARTPLIISGQSDQSPDLYVKVNRLVPQLVRQANEEAPGDYWVDEKGKQVHLSEQGMADAESILVKMGLIGEEESLYDPRHLAIVHHLNAALRAHTLFLRDKEYIVRNGEVIIVDEFTGRTLAGRRWSEGLHQAVEAKEGVPIQPESQTMASITFQNFFRMYKKLSGMTGTADTEAFEFQQIYGLECVVIPTHRPMVRKDAQDSVFLNKGDKFNAIIEDVLTRNANGQPILIGTTSVESSEELSRALEEKAIKHEVLNAKQHDREAIIVAQAGRPNAVTIATNMAGRGTDIVLGGSLEAELHALPTDASDSQKQAVKDDWQKRHAQVKTSGGLHIIGTERHESRRIDNQLRGRSGRQGDPGSSRFYLAFDDHLMRIFAAERLSSLMQRLGMKPGESIEHSLVNRAIENSQRKVEAHNFDIRKNLLDFDDVANDQRRAIYGERNALMDADDISSTIAEQRADVMRETVLRFVPAQSIDEQWNLKGLTEELTSKFGLEFDAVAVLKEHPELDWEAIQERVVAAMDSKAAAKEAEFSPEVMRMAERQVMLQVMDATWKEHLAKMDYLRQGIHLRGYAQKQPKQEYKRESFEMFELMVGRVRTDVVGILANIRMRDPEPEATSIPEDMRYRHPSMAAFDGSEEPAMVDDDFVVTEEVLANTGRNDPCPCGSGKKFKHCHGQIA
jgi:preprotein translocase subunit SecA